MKNLKVLLISFALLFAVGLVAMAQEALPEQISDLTCSIEKPCPNGLECFSFPEIGLRCAQPAPCSYYKCPADTKCLVGEIYPPLLICSPLAGAEEPEATKTVEKMINLDEDVEPQDLEIKEPRLLPDSPFYFLKNWARGIRDLVTINPIKKAELRMKFANEKLMEVKKMIQEKKNPEKIKKAAENYQQEAEKIKNQVKKIKEKAKENPKVESFLDKFIHQQILHQKLLQKLETQVPPEAFEKIKEAREEHLERFKDVMLKLEDRTEKITEKLDKILDEQKGSPFKEFKNLEVLKNLEEKVPEEAKEAIKKAEENTLKRLQGDLEKMSPKDQEKFKEYIEKISGEEEKHLEILENLKSEIKTVPETPKILELKENLEKVKERIKEKIKEKKGEPVACAQIITYCIDPSTGECAVYPDACSTPKPCQSCLIEMLPGTGL